MAVVTKKKLLCNQILQSLFNSISTLGEHDDRDLMIKRDQVGDMDSPKHGKIDPSGAPHVGGNTWAGGTGGRDTAGLGGIGGPYRLGRYDFT